MRSIKARFRRISEKIPNASSYLCFSNAIKEQGFCERRIALVFNQLVDVEDYDDSIKRAVLHGLYEISKPVEACMKSG